MLISAGKLFKVSKIAWTRRASAIGSLKIFQVLIYTKLRRKSCFHLLIIYMKKKKQNKARARILNFYLVYNFALVFHEKCLVSSQLEACRFFISIICRVFSRVFETIFWNYDNSFFGGAPCEASRLMRKAAAWSELFPRNCITFSLW